MAPLLLIQALTPFLPLITKVVDAKKSGKTLVDTIRSSTGGTEAGQVGIVSALFLAYQDVISCNPVFTLDSLSCVSNEHWGALAVASVFAFTQLLRKANTNEPA
jgi:hypothetical protein